MIPPRKPFRQACNQCGWKSPIIQNSDCIIGYYECCPKCGGKLEFKDLNKFEVAIQYLKQAL
ncbi:hypothetical protein A1D22_00645 [Pasteurellaceae bacterium LFhippo2]|nr:hypothetical protein [Pasteurellaceae bacterium LFhippo2]